MPRTKFLDIAAAKIQDDAPFYTEVTKDKDGKLILGPTLTQKQVLDHPRWFFAKNLFEQKYFEVKRDDC